MKQILKIFIVFIFFIFISCSKEDKQPNQKNGKDTKQETENPEDTIMSPEEKFSTSITEDFLDAPEDEDLQAYLEDELFNKYSKDFRGASLMQLTNTIWFVSLETNNTTKNFLLQKFVDFNSNDYYFVLKETTLTGADVISSANLFRNSSVIKEKDKQPPQSENPK